MKILVVSSYFDTHPGGLETIAGRLSAELCEAGHQVKWMATDATAPRQSNVEVVALRSWNAVERRLGLPLPLLTPAAIVKLHRAVKDSDLVFVHDTLYM
ncbi:MAG: glycosyltransferase, partial [Caulobacteraceae bacterium]